MLSNWHLRIVITCLKAFEFESHDADKKGRQKQTNTKQKNRNGERKEGSIVSKISHLAQNELPSLRDRRGLRESSASINVDAP